MTRKCEVCGARLRNWNTFVTTCDTTCTKAKRGHRTRAAQFQLEMQLEAEQATQEADETNPVNYSGNLELDNRPYLAGGYA